MPSNRPLLDWLAAEFVARHFSMKQMHRLIVTSETYKLATEVDPKLAAANAKVDSSRHVSLAFSARSGWRPSRFGTRSSPRPAIWIWRSAGRRSASRRRRIMPRHSSYRRFRELMPMRIAGPPICFAAFRSTAMRCRHFLKAFDVDDGHAPCPMRTQTVTAPQALFMMNSDEVERASAEFGERLQKECGHDLPAAVDRAYEITLARPPSAAERARALAYLDNDPARLKGFAWLLFNLDEFIYPR